MTAVPEFLELGSGHVRMQLPSVRERQYAVMRSPDHQFGHIHLIDRSEMRCVVLGHEMPKTAQQGPFGALDRQWCGEPRLEPFV